MKVAFYIYNIFIYIFVLLLSSCDLTEEPRSSADKEMIFGSKDGLGAYSYSFYNELPDYNTAFKLDNVAVDYIVKNLISTYEAGAYTVNEASSWNWAPLRNINYFIKHNVNDNVSESIRNNYTGIARFFRAYFYFDKLVTYGEVPWIDTLIENDDIDKLYASRDSRDLIIKKIIEDLDYAFQNILEVNPTGDSNLVNKWCAAFLKSRICLFEASWRKYHKNSAYVEGLVITPEELFEDAANAAKLIIDSKVYDIYNGVDYSGGRGAYRELFISDHTITKEVMLACSLDKELQMGEQNWWYNSSTYGNRWSMSRPFAKLYLNIDGTVYNEKNEDGSYKNFVEETTGRDLRLNQTIRGADYTCLDSKGKYVQTSANFTGHSLTGYQFTKYIKDDVTYNDGRKNDNDIPIFRYAEVLLNYAEAKAELGTLTDEDWKNTIGILRKRAGIVGGDLEHLPTIVDSYIQHTYFPLISDPVILEIRRERSIELCLEGTRLMDLKRWACADLWENSEWTGVYIPVLDTPLDMNGDGKYDVFFTKSSKYTGDYSSILVKLNSTQTVLPLEDDPNKGYLYLYNVGSRIWNDNMYLYPIPQEVININPNLSQNPGW